MPLPEPPDVIAPDGSEVRVLVRAEGGSMAHFRLLPGQTSVAVPHRRVEEVWYVVAGAGEMWTDEDGASEVIALRPGLSLHLAPGTAFQFRATGPEPLDAVGVTMPPWPLDGSEEAVAVAGPWAPTVAPGPVRPPRPT